MSLGEDAARRRLSERLETVFLYAENPTVCA